VRGRAPAARTIGARMRAVKSTAPELTVVMPAHNEEGAIPEAVATWAATLDALGIDYELRVYDDGSTDKTGAVLGELANRFPRIVVTSHANRGHGPTILRGYAEARGDWVFQTDSDGEMPASAFEALWARRHAYDFLLGYRVGPRANATRQLVTTVARLAVAALFRARLRDVNTPYRLMRRPWLQSAVSRVPPDLFAPNVVLAGLAARERLRIYEHPVPYHSRQGGPVRLIRGRLWRAAFRSLAQTAAVAFGRGQNPSA